MKKRIKTIIVLLFTVCLLTASLTGTVLAEDSGDASNKPFSELVGKHGDWFRSGNKWYYTIGYDLFTGGTINIGKDGTAYDVSGKLYLFNASGAMVSKYGWHKVSKKWYFMNSDKSVQTGWKKIGGKWYAFWDNREAVPVMYAAVTGMLGASIRLTRQGQMFCNTTIALVTKSGQGFYSFNKNGVMRTGWVKNKKNKKWYYHDKSSGKAVEGWEKIGGKWYYFSPYTVKYGINGNATVTGCVMQTGWKKIKSKWYYLNSNGAMQIGWKKIKGKWYYFNGNGVWVK